MDGEITIGTSLSTDKFDRQVAQLEKKMQKEEEKKIVLQAKIEVQEQEFEIARQKTDELADAYQRLDQLQKTIASGKATPEQFTMAQELQRTYGSLDQLEISFLKALNKQDAINEKAYEMRTKYQEINDKVAEYKQKIESIKLQQQVSEVNRLKDGFYGVGSSIQNAIGQAGRLVLGIFSIRSAYMGVRQAISTLSQYNSTLANQITAIKLALVSAIEPVINFIVGVVSKVVGFIGYILKMLFGIDIFARATALSFGKIKAGASGASKSVKEIRKQLAGFDEANVLNENGTTGGVGGVGGALDGIKDIAKDLQDLNIDGEKVFKNFRKWLLGSDKKNIKGIWQDNLKIIKDFLKDTKKAFEPLGEWIDKNAWQPIKTLFKQTMKDLQPFIEPIKEKFRTEVEKIKPIWRDLLERYLKPLWSGFTTFIKDKVTNPILDLFRPLGEKIYNFLVPHANNIIKLINKTFGAFGIHLEEWQYKTETATNNVEGDFKEATTNMQKDSDSKGKSIEKNINNPLGNIKDKIKDVAKQTLNINTNTSKLDTLKTKLKNIWETLKDIVTGKWEFTLRASGGGGTGSFGYGGSGGYRAHGGIYYPSKLPKLASGGIINVPGRGVPYNGAIIGERGAEAVVPLTDRQQMELLGATIGKYININATIPISVGNRQVAREIRKIQAEENFAFNQ